LNENTRKEIELHSAGATVRHAGPYSDLDAPSSTDFSDVDFFTVWVKPFYMTDLVRDQRKFRRAYASTSEAVNSSIITQLLTLFNWRTRLVGAYFAAIHTETDHCDHIGRLLLRSDVCYAGNGYALALAQFNTKNSIDYLRKYLDHYLHQHDLWFDQAVVMAALAYLDRLNATENMPSYLDQWKRFVENKPEWNLDRSVTRFDEQIQSLQSMA
jgi:hypothetical protein